MTILWRSLPNVRSKSTSIGARQYDQLFSGSVPVHVNQRGDDDSIGDPNEKAHPGVNTPEGA